MAEGARLESVFTRKGNVGSNPTLSATQSEVQRYLPASSRKYQENAAFLQIPVRKWDWRKCPVPCDRRALPLFLRRAGWQSGWDGIYVANRIRSQSDDVAKAT